MVMQRLPGKQFLKGSMNKKASTKPLKGLENGQSFVELILIFPILMILLSGVVEFGYLLNQYINLVDAAREGARYGSNADPFIREVAPGCPTPICIDLNYLLQVDQITESALAPIHLNPDVGDDVVISFFGVDNGVPTRYLGDEGWSYYGYYGYTGHQVSRFSTADIQSRLLEDAPNSGILVVEIYYHYNQVLKIWAVAGIPETFEVHAYSIMPLAAVEPQAFFPKKYTLSGLIPPFSLTNQSLISASFVDFMRVDSQ
jgi:hypothetical protein